MSARLFCWIRRARRGQAMSCGSTGRSLVIPVIAITAMMVASSSAPAAPSRKSGVTVSLEVLQAQQEKLETEFADRLEALAKTCDDKKLSDAAQTVRNAKTPSDHTAFRARPLPTTVQPDLPAGLAGEERYWQTQLRLERSNHAKDLYQLSRRALHAEHLSYALQLVQEVVHHDPDHKLARGLLGFVQVGNEWLTPFAAEMQRKKYVDHPRFGWIPQNQVERYEAGERLVKSRWMTVAKEAEIRRDFNNAWEARSEHFLVKTNHSLEKAVEISRALEDFYAFFRQTFTPFFSTPDQLRKLFEGQAQVSRGGLRPHEVHYYRTRLEYNERLRKYIPQIDMTNGLYRPADRTAYFFHDPDLVNESTMFHEATHQMLYETGRDREIAQKSDFWIVEGIACYMESYSRADQGASLGDPRFERFSTARRRYLKDDYYVPLKQFVQPGMSAFQLNEKLAWNYQQSAGLAEFFMDAHDGKYRDALMDYLCDIYSTNDLRREGPQGLDELTGISYGELDKEYGDFVRRQEDRARSLPPLTPGLVEP